MKGRVILLDMPGERGSQAARLEDGRLEDLLLDPPKGDGTPRPGEIYWAKVDRLVPGIGGAFVKLTPKHQGFLRETKGVKQGSGLLVQVTSYPEPGKATPVTTRLLYKGRQVIHTPGAPGINVSRQIRDPEERDRLAKIVENWTPDQGTVCEPALSQYREYHGGGGFILRSAAQSAEEDAILREIHTVLGARSEREGLSRRSEPGASVVASLALTEALREWITQHPATILASESAASHVQGDPQVGPGAIAQMTLRVESDPFERFELWDEIDRLRQPRVDLPSGAWMAIEATRAMVTVDVNTGERFSGGAGMTANIEAARELPRQLRLRGLGGQVIIDFAPLKKAHRRKVEETLKAAFRKDPIETTLAGWTPLGNFELQRKRERRPLSELLPG